MTFIESADERKMFTRLLHQLTRHKDRYIKSASIQLLKRLQEITEELQDLD